MSEISNEQVRALYDSLFIEENDLCTDEHLAFACARVLLRENHSAFNAGLRDEARERVAKYLEDTKRTCWCVECEDMRLAKMSDWNALLSMTFIVCPTCGNKRCPKAQQHDRVCTGSNDVGQPGGG